MAEEELTLESIKKGIGLESPKPPTKTLINKNVVESVPLIAGDFAKILSPRLETNPPKLDLEALKSKVLGKPKSSDKIPLSDPKEMSEIVALTENKPLTLADIKSKAMSSPIKGGISQRSTGDKMVEVLNSETAKNVFTTLGIDEHLIVKGLSRTFNSDLPPKENLMDYNWTNFLLDNGAPDNGFTTSAGIAMSIFLSPSTYLTFGAGPAAKLTRASGVAGKKFLTKKGVKLINDTVKTEANILKANKAAKLGRELTEKEANKIVQNTRRVVQDRVLKRFEDMAELGNRSRIDKTIKALPDNIVQAPSMRLEVPGFPEMTIIKGETALKIADKSGIPALGRAIKDTEAFRQTRQVLDPVTDLIRQGKDELGRMFIPNYGVSRKMLDAFRNAKNPDELLRNLPGDDATKSMAYITAQVEDFAAKAEDLKNASFAEAERFFKGLNAAERQDFARSALGASQRAEKIEVKSVTKNPKVQAKLDQWFGQGVFKHTKSIADELAEKSKLIDDKRLANWFPGIDDRLTADALTWRKSLSPSKREFLKERMGDPTRYTMDPIKAVGYRMTEINYANLQDEFYNNIVKNKLGNMRFGGAFKSEAEALEKGFVKLRPPFRSSVVNGSDIATRKGADDLIWVDKRFADQYNEVVFREDFNVPFLSWVKGFTGLFKRSVTAAFPAFHTRNFNSNIVLNGMRIGRHAVDPKKFNLAMDAVRGKNLTRVFKTEIGEKLSVKGIIDEAKEMGVLKKGFFQHDIAGETMTNIPAQKTWINTVNRYLNPFSQEWLPVATGFKWGEAIESQARLVNYLTWRQKGLSPKQAAIEVNEALFDYQALTKTERLLNTTVIPFYTFSRKNFENHMKIALRKPGVVGAQLKFFREMGPTDKEWREKFPEWAKRKFTAKFKGNILTGWGLPLEDVMEVLDLDTREAILRTNPMFRFPIERIAEKDFFTNRELQKVNNANEFKFIVEILERGDAPEPIKAALRPVADMFDLRRDPGNRKKIIGSPDALHVLRNLFTSRWQSTIGSISKEDRPAYESAIKFLLGWNVLPGDKKLKLSIEKGRKREELKKIAEKTNIAKPMDFFFVGSDEFGVEMANEYLRRVNEGQSVKQVRRALEQFEKRAIKRRERKQIQ